MTIRTTYTRVLIAFFTRCIIAHLRTGAIAVAS